MPSQTSISSLANPNYSQNTHQNTKPLDELRFINGQLKPLHNELASATTKFIKHPDLISIKMPSGQFKLDKIKTQLKFADNHLSSQNKGSREDIQRARETDQGFVRYYGSGSEDCITVENKSVTAYALTGIWAREHIHQGLQSAFIEVASKLSNNQPLEPTLAKNKKLFNSALELLKPLHLNTEADGLRLRALKQNFGLLRPTTDSAQAELLMLLNNYAIESLVRPPVPELSTAAESTDQNSVVLLDFLLKGTNHEYSEKSRTQDLLRMTGLYFDGRLYEQKIIENFLKFKEKSEAEVHPQASQTITTSLVESNNEALTGILNKVQKPVSLAEEEQKIKETYFTELAKKTPGAF